MFDIGFSELCMVALVSLLVIGPERLPKAARVAGFWIGKMRTLAASVKAEISQELHAEELRQALKHDSGLQEFRDMMDEATDTVHSIQTDIQRAQQDVLEHPQERHESN